MHKEIFRKVALDRLSSPDQLDQLMEVTSPKWWLGLAGVAMLLATGVVWGVMGSLPEVVAGRGILIRSAGVYEVASQAGGRVDVVGAQVGDSVRRGQVVARLSQPDMVEQLNGARARLAELEYQHRHLTAFVGRDENLQAIYFAQQRTSLQQLIAAAEAEHRTIEQRVETERRLTERGLSTRQALQASMRERDAVAERIRASRNEASQLNVQELQARNGRQMEIQASSLRLLEARREVNRYAAELRLAAEVVSPFAGRVLEIMVEEGTVVERGRPLLTVDVKGAGATGLKAVVFVPSVEGKKLRPGMEMRVSPSSVKREEFGYLLGRVTYVSDFPATSGGMRRVLKNDQLVAALSGADAPFEVHADLVPSLDNVSAYRWSSSAGPPVRIQSGTIVAADIVVERRRPILMVIPQLRRLEGPARGTRSASLHPAEPR